MKKESHSNIERTVSKLVTKALNPVRKMCVIDPAPVILKKLFPKSDTEEVKK